MQWFSKVWRALGLACAVLVAASCGGSGGPSQEAVVSKAASGPFAGNGFYWNPTEPGTGMFFELQGTTGVLTLYMYDDSSRAAWYMASGTLTGSGGIFNFTGRLLRYAGGQAGSSTIPRKPTSTDMGEVRVAFDDGTARVFAPNAPVFNMVRFNAPGSGKPATGTQPETGIYWNPAEDGRGYVVEVNNDTAMLGAFHYDAAGNPTWHLVVAPLTSPQAGGDFAAYTGGRTLTGPWKAAVPSPITGQFGVAFQQPCLGRLNFPQMAPIDVRRFAFGVQVAGSECRAQPASGPGKPADVSGVSLSLKSPARLEGDALQGGRLTGEFTFDYVGDAAVLAGKTLYVRLDDPDALFEGGASALVETSLTRAGVKLVGNPLPRAGRYQGNLRMSLCMDAGCSVPVPGSPHAIAYDFTARVGLSSSVASTVALNFKPTDETITVPIMVTVPANSKDTLQLQGVYVQFEVPGQTALQAGSWRIPVSAQPQQIQVLASISRNYVDYLPYMVVKVDTGVSGVAMGPTVQSSMRINFIGRLLVELNTNLTPLSPLPGAPAWTTYQGNAAHTGYVPAVLDAARFNRRFTRQQAGGSAVVAQGGRICRSAGASPRSSLECLSEQTGEPLWSVAWGTGTSISSPAMSSGKVYMPIQEWGNLQWTLHVADAATGARVARYPIGSSRVDSVTVAGNTAYLAGSGSQGVGTVDLAQDGRYGVVGYTPYGTGGMYAATVSAGRLYTAANGNLFTIPDPTVNQFTLIADPGAQGAMASLAHTSAVVVDGTAAYLALWERTNKPHMTRFDLAAGAASWSIPGEFISNPVPVGDTVYILKAEALEARSASDGSIRWSVPMPGKYAKGGSLIVVGKYAFASVYGTRAIDLETRQQVWFDSATGSLSVSENGILYINSSDLLVAVNLR